jgi:hypothetical protein
MNDSGKQNALEYLENLTQKAYDTGYKAGMKNTLIKLASYYKYCKYVDDIDICIAHAAGLKDMGCPCNCVECIDNHFNSDDCESGHWSMRKDCGLDILNCPICYNDINCNHCGEYYIKHWKFCPNCGARLIYGGEEND